MHSLVDYLKDINETAAAGSVSAGDIGGFRGMLFGGPDNLERRPVVGKVEVVKFHNEKPHLVKVKKLKNGKSITEASTGGDKLNKQLVTGILSKLRSNVRQAAFNYQNDVTTYGLEGDDGKTVKITIPTEQARDFDQKLMSILRNDRKRGERGFSSKQIGEIIFDLRKEFDIVNVTWPKITGDSEEEEVDVPADQQTQPDNADAPTDQPVDGAEPTPDMSAPADPGVTSLLQQIIQMMQADAEAKLVQAKAEEAKYVQQISAQKMQQEQEVLDMEAYYKDKKKQETEAKKLQQLAKWKHEIAQDDGSDLSSSSPDVNLNVNLDSDDNNEDDEDDQGMQPPLSSKSQPMQSEEEEATVSTGQLTNKNNQHQLLKYLLRTTKAQR